MPLAHALLGPLFLDLARRRVPAPARAWLEQAAPGAAAAGDVPRLRAALADAARHCGRAPVATGPEERAALAAAGVSWPLERWRCDELVRVALLLGAAACLEQEALEALVEGCYRGGDSRERQAVLRALPLLPAPERFLTVALEACRSSLLPVFEAIACDNPYPAARFHELHFNQMVLHMFGAGVPLARLIGLEGRTTAELVRLAEAHVSERRATGRRAPDIAPLLGTRRPAA